MRRSALLARPIDAPSEQLEADLGELDDALEQMRRTLALIEASKSGLSAMTTVLSGLRQCAVRAGNSSLRPPDRTSLALEGAARLAELHRIADATEFEGQRILNGRAELDIDDTLSDEGIDVRASTLGLDKLDLSTASCALDALKAVDAAFAYVAACQMSLATVDRRLAGALQRLEVSRQNVRAAAATFAAPGT